MTIINTNSIAGINSITALGSQPFSIYDTGGYNRLTLDTSGNITILGTLTVSNLNYTYLNVTGVSTFNNGPVLIGSATSTGTVSQPLQVTGKAYISDSIGIGTTNPSSKLHVFGSSASNIVAIATATTITIDMTTGNNFSVTLNGNYTLGNPTGITTGQSGVIFLTQDGTGSKTIGFSSYWDFPSGAVPTLTTTANAVDALFYVVRNATSIVTNSILNIN